MHKNKNPPYMHIKIVLFIITLGDPNNIKRTMDGAVYAR